MKKISSVKTQVPEGPSAQIAREGAAPGRVRKKEAEEISNLLWWRRGEGSVSPRSLCECRDGEVAGNAHRRHPLVKRGRI